MDDTRQVTQNGEQDVNEEISVASALEEDTDRREDDGKNDLADITVWYQVKSASIQRCASQGGRIEAYLAVKGIFAVVMCL